MKPLVEQPDTLTVSDSILSIVTKTIQAELEYERATNCGRKFGITGEVGEILVCQTLDLKLVKDPRAEGFDAIDKKGCHVQIKTRRAERGELPKETGRLSKFSNHACDYALLGILNMDYKLVQVWKAEHAHLKPIIAKHKRANPTIKQFKNIGKLIYP